ncbi:MAG: methyltransferase [Methanobrevibacter sp.]|nr:methyltransferase [Methanobrevibacter sp.]
MEIECSCENSCIITSEKIEKYLSANDPCSKCKEPNIKKFKPLSEQVSLEDIDNDFGRCSCGKRSLDSVMAHVLKVIIDLNVDIGKDTLRNGPIPLITPFYTMTKLPFIDENSLVILDDRLEKKDGEYIVENVKEVKGVLKGSSHDTVGIKDFNSSATVYELLSGCDIRCDIIQSYGKPIAINKIQHLSYLEFPQSMENKIMKLCSYIKSKHLSPEKIANLRILDGTCGNGSLGIFLLNYGVEKVIFNDIWYPATVSTSINLESNGFKVGSFNIKNNNRSNRNKKNNHLNINNIYENHVKSPLNYKIAEGEKFEVYNFAIENLANNLKDNHEIDLCILDCFPNVNTVKFEKVAKSIANEVWII